MNEHVQRALAQLQQQLVESNAKIVNLTQAQAAAIPIPKPERVVDTRVLQKPKEFGGTSEDWPSWAFSMRAYIGAVDSKLLDVMKRAAITKDKI